MRRTVNTTGTVHAVPRTNPRHFNPTINSQITSQTKPVQQVVYPYWDDVYNFNYPSRGKAIIINNMKFDPRTKQTDRKGSEVDARNLMETFQKLGFETVVLENLTSTRIIVELAKVSKEDHSDADCFACIILSHGDQALVYPSRHCAKVTDIVYGTDGIVYLHQITDQFQDEKCPSLAGKPKLFFIQACRGGDLSAAVEVTDSGGEKEEDGTDCIILQTQSLPIYKDYLLAYSSPPGFYSFRRNSGSWFIQCLCRCLQQYGHRMELQRILTRVSHDLARDYESKSRGVFNKKKQMCWVASQLTADIYFKPKPLCSQPPASLPKLAIFEHLEKEKGPRSPVFV